MKSYLAGALACALMSTAATAAYAASDTEPYSYTVIGEIAEAGARVVALAIEFDDVLPLNWNLAGAFSVTAALPPVTNYSGQTLGDSAAPEAPRTILRAYTRASADLGAPQQGNFVIIELEPQDPNGAYWYHGYNPGFRQVLPYEQLDYEIDLLQDLSVIATTNPAEPSAEARSISQDATFEQAGRRLEVVDDFTQGVFALDTNPTITEIGYNLYVPETDEGAKVPLVVFLHGSGQSHDTVNYPDDVSADVISPLSSNQGVVTWIANAPEPAVVLAPQAPARDLPDDEGRGGWNSTDTQALLIGLIDSVVADNPQIDTDRIYISGVSMGAIGTWGLLTHPDPEVSQRFAGAVIVAGRPLAMGLTGFEPGIEDPLLRRFQLAQTLESADLSQVRIPLYITASNTDPVVDVLGSRIPFANLTGQAHVATDFSFAVDEGVLVEEEEFANVYVGTNVNSGAEVRYVEHQYNDGRWFVEMGMVTPNGHNHHEIDFKNPEIVEWLFAQRRGQ